MAIDMMILLFLLGICL